MSEERFSVEDNINNFIIYDNDGIDDYYHLGNDERDVKAICKLLNKFYDDNLQLKVLLHEAEEEINNLKKSNQLLMETHMDQESEDNPQLRFGKFRQKMCGLLWENGCYDISLADDVNAKRIFNQSHNICNGLLEDYNITEK